MIDRPDFLTDKCMREFKRRAKSICRKEEVKHGHALEVVAKEHSFKNWLQLTQQRRGDAEVESFAKEGVVLVFDNKDAPETSLDGTLVKDDRLVNPCLPRLVHAVINRHHMFGHYDLEPTFFDTDEDVLDAYAWFSFHRVSYDLKNDSTPMDILKHVRDYTFHPPAYISIQGVFRGCHDEQEFFAW